MRALTLRQPWCGLVAAGVKLVENRPRSMIKRADFGKPFALHASREIDEGAYDTVHEIAPELYDYEANRKTMSAWYRLSRITSAVIAIATIDRVVDDYDQLDRELGEQRRWYFGPIGYVFRDVRALPEPVPCSGWQGFWRLTVDVKGTVVAQLARDV